MHRIAQTTRFHQSLNSCHLIWHGSCWSSNLMDISMSEIEYFVSRLPVWDRNLQRMLVALAGLHSRSFLPLRRWGSGVMFSWSWGSLIQGCWASLLERWEVVELWWRCNEEGKESWRHQTISWWQFGYHVVEKFYIHPKLTIFSIFYQEPYTVISS